MSAPSSSPPPVLTFAPPGHPVLGPWRAALARAVPTCAVWGADRADLLRSLIARREPDSPRLLPLAPWGPPWRAAHGRWLRRRWPMVHAVVFTRPDQALLLDAFANTRRLYYALDDYATYGRSWLGAERMLLAQTHHTVCVSRSLAAVLAEREPSAAERITVLPNAIPAAWVPSAPPTRPLAGVLGRVSSRLRLDWLLEIIENEPWLHWLFVGDIEASEVADADWPRIERLKRHPRCTLLGARPFAAFRGFAAALDVAVLPYSARSTNPHGSAVRLFVHLPCAAPLLATPGCGQVAEFQPLVELCASPAALAAALRALRARDFDDGRRHVRWQAAHEHTWDVRVRAWLPLLTAP